MQLYELEAWLGDNHGLSDDQLAELLRQADEIEERCDGDEDEMRAEFLTAYRLIAEHSEDVIRELSDKRLAAVAAEAAALAGLRQAALTLVDRGDFTESGFARAAGVDRMTVRKWLGKR